MEGIKITKDTIFNISEAGCVLWNSDNDFLEGVLIKEGFVFRGYPREHCFGIDFFGLSEDEIELISKYFRFSK